METQIAKKNEKLKLNLGCGYKKRAGFINVDIDSGCKPDLVLDLENSPWPWETNSVDEVVLDHILEHLGETKAQYFHVIKELYRVCSTGASIQIRVPHPRHDNFMHDCTHVRPITPEGLAMFSVQRNLESIANGAAESCLGLHLAVNFELKKVNYVLENFFMQAVQAGQLNDQQMHEILRTQNNICQETLIELVALK